MTKLALAGGKPVTKNLMSQTRIKPRPDLERKYLLEAFDSGLGDDWPKRDKSQASRFAREFAAFKGAKFCAMLTNGTHALQVALETVDIGFGDEVIVPGLTWQATASAVCDVNAVPVLVDVDPSTMCIDPAKIEEAITRRTKAIMPVHLGHRMADMGKIKAIARKHGLYVVEDTAHAHGSTWDGKGAGAIGDFGSFSFQASKVLRSFEGGCLLTNSEDDYWRITSQRMCGREYNGVKVHSGNYRMTSLQCGVLRGQLAAFRKNAPLMEKGGKALDAAVAAAPGVAPQRRSTHLTRQVGYTFGFLFEPEQFDGLSGNVFRQALSAELGWRFGSTYTPLNHSEVYYPQTKKRHKLSREYIKAITPSRWHLPVIEDLWKNRAVITSWHILGLPPTRAHLLTDAIVKIYENRGDLIAWAKKQK